MAKKITQEYILKVVASGLKEVTREIKTLNTNLTGMDSAVETSGKSFDKVSKKQDTYLRGTKGAAKATNNSTKAFSKMAQNVNGTLVPAYATVAANVFALTAAFGALKRAADLEILITSAETLAVQTGRSLITLSRGMKDITNNALTMKEALESASIAASAGFDDTTIKNLTQVARNASVALGRDMTDSLNRVFKGAIKAEPELLDELGIILRLDTAARNYAATLGKSAQALTTFEKQQAVVNAVLEQGQDKFGEFAEVDVNPYTQLASSFQDISAVLIQLINIPISPVLRFLTENVEALTAVIVLFSASVLKKAFPALTNFAEVMETKLTRATRIATIAMKKAEKSNISFKQSLTGITTESQQTLKTFTKGIFQVRDVVQKEGVKISKNFKTSFTLGTDSLKGIEAYKKGIQGVLAAFKRGTKVSQGFKNTEENVAFLNEELGETNAVIKGIEKDAIKLTGRMQSFGKGITTTFTTATKSVLAFGTAITKSAIGGALAGYTKGFSGVSENLKAISKETTGITRAFSLVTGAISGTGGALLRMLPIIGQLVFAWSLLSAAFTFIKDSLVGKALVDISETLKDNTEALQTAAKSAIFFNNRLKDLPDTLDNIDKKAKLLSNTMGTLADNLDKTLKDIEIDKGFGGFDEFLDRFALGNLDEFKDQLEDINETMSTFGFQDEANSILEEFTNLTRLSGDEAIIAGEKLRKHLEAIRDSARGTLDLNTVIKDSLSELNKGLTQLNDGLPALSGTEKGFVNLNTILSSLDTGNIHQVTSSIEKLTSFDLQQLGLTKIAENISKIKAPLAGLNKELRLAKANLEKLKIQERIGKIDFDTTEGENALNKLNSEITGIKSQIDGITEKLSDQTAGIISGLDKVKDRFNLIINAQRVIADIRAKNATSNLEEGKGLGKRLELLDSLTKAENNYLTTISSQTRKSLDDVNTSIKKTEAALLRVGKDEGKEASLLTALKASESKRIQLNNKLLADRNKIAGNYIKQIKVIQKELSATTKFAAAGLTVSEEQADILENKLLTAYLNLGKAQGKNLIDASKFAGEMTLAATAVQDFNDFLQKTRIPSADAIVGSLKVQSTKLELLEVESNYLKDNDILLDSRIDKEFIITKIIKERELSQLRIQQASTNVGTKQYIELAKQIEGITLLLENNEAIREKTVKKSTAALLHQTRLEIASGKARLQAGALATKSELSRIKRLEKLNVLTAKGFDTSELTGAFKELEDVQFAENITKQLGDIVDALDPYKETIEELNAALANDKVDNFSAGLLAMTKIAKTAGDEVSEAIFSLSIAFETFAQATKDGKETMQDYLSLASSAIGAIAKAYDEGSEQAKAFAVAQQALAIISAVVAVLEQGKGDPYSAFARIAAMAGVVTAVLGAANVAFGGVSGTAGAGSEYESTIGGQGLVGTTLETTSLIDSVDDLVKTNTNLFSVERELQLAMKNLADVFLDLAKSLIVGLGGFGDVATAANFGKVFGKQKGAIGTGSGQSYSELNNILNNLDPGAALLSNTLGPLLEEIGFSTKEVNATIVDSGIEFGASINLIGGILSGSINDAAAVLVAQVETTTNDFFGLISKTNTQLETYYKSLPKTLENALDQALNQTLSTITNVFTVFGAAVNVNLQSLFEDAGTIDVATLRLSLKNKSVQEQSDVIAAWFSNMGNTVIATVIPFITEYSNAGEELLDTLIRLTNTTLQLADTFSQVGLDISIIADTSTINTSGVTGAINSVVEATKLEMIAAWQAAFLKNFKDLEEFNETFINFANAIFSEAELADIALQSATEVVSNGFDILRATLEEQGDLDLLAALGPENTAEAIRALYDLGTQTNAFAAIVDATTGEIDTSGADLFAIILQLGEALGIQQQATEDLIAGIEDLNQQYERQIALFGLVGKELELLQLSFDFQDAIIEAEETGSDLALVETFYGLQRLDIIRKYNQEIVDSINTTMENVSNSILTVISSASGWNEVAYQSIRVTRLVDKLSSSLGSLGTGIDFAVFSDLTDTGDFLESLEQFITTAADMGETINDQINLVEDLRDAVMSRYEAEVAANQELESSILDTISGLKDLSAEINTFLDDLFVGDLSPLTNAQKLAEAQTQFDTNLQNVLSQDTELAEASRSELLQSASKLLELANLFFAIGPEYQAIFNDVVGSLESIDQNILAEIGLSEETLAINSLEDSLTELQLQTITQLQTLDDILVALEERNLSDLNDELSTTQMPEVINNLEAINTKLEQINNDSWNPILLELQNLSNIWTTFTSGINGFAKGSEEISYDQVAMIHKGETILTADTSNAIRSGESVYGTTDALSNDSNGNSSEVVEAIRILTQVVAAGQEDIIDKNEEVRLATKSIGVGFNSTGSSGTKGIV